MKNTTRSIMKKNTAGNALNRLLDFIFLQKFQDIPGNFITFFL